MNNPTQLQKVLATVCRLSPSIYLQFAISYTDDCQLTAIKDNFNKAACGGKQVSLADLIVLGGNAAIEKAAAAAGYGNLTVPRTVGRVDATQDDTDIASFETLNPQGDGFRK